jgi:hypothetical protein
MGLTSPHLFEHTQPVLTDHFSDSRFRPAPFLHGGGQVGKVFDLPDAFGHDYFADFEKPARITLVAEEDVHVTGAAPLGKVGSDGGMVFPGDIDRPGSTTINPSMTIQFW